MRRRGKNGHVENSLPNELLIKLTWEKRPFSQTTQGKRPTTQVRSVGQSARPGVGRVHQVRRVPHPR